MDSWIDHDSKKFLIWRKIRDSNPGRDHSPSGFPYHYGFRHRHIAVCGLDFAFAITFSLRREPSSLYTFLMQLGFARRYLELVRGSAEFDSIHPIRFRKGARFHKTGAIDHSANLP